jgi:hypothetical protein
MIMRARPYGRFPPRGDIRLRGLGQDTEARDIQGGGTYVPPPPSPGVYNYLHCFHIRANPGLASISAAVSSLYTRRS